MQQKQSSQAPKRARRQPPVDEAASARRRQAATFKAGGGGSLAVLILLLVGLLPLPVPVPCIVIPGLVIVYSSVGVLAGVLAGDHIYTGGQATQAGALAGFLCGVGGGVVAMALAALGLIFSEWGPRVAEQFPEMQRALTDLGMASERFPQLVAVLLALGICGAAGTAIALVLGALGGRIYFRLR